MSAPGVAPSELHGHFNKEKRRAEAKEWAHNCTQHEWIRSLVEPLSSPSLSSSSCDWHHPTRAHFVFLMLAYEKRRLRPEEGATRAIMRYGGCLRASDQRRSFSAKPAVNKPRQRHRGLPRGGMGVPRAVCPARDRGSAPASPDKVCACLFRSFVP